MNTSYYPPTEGTTDFVFGNSYTYPFHGLIDDFRIYNRALSASQISATYNAEK